MNEREGQFRFKSSGQEIACFGRRHHTNLSGHILCDAPPAQVPQIEFDMGIDLHVAKIEVTVGRTCKIGKGILIEGDQNRTQRGSQHFVVDLHEVETTGQVILRNRLRSESRHSVKIIGNHGDRDVIVDLRGELPLDSELEIHPIKGTTSFKIDGKPHSFGAEDGAEFRTDDKQIYVGIGKIHQPVSRPRPQTVH